MTLSTKRNFAVIYKQTILGPLWILLNPLITTILFNVIFGGIAGLPTEGAPSFLFIMAGNTLWTMFAACINNTANTFVANAGMFGKVYFPRLTIPLSQVLTAAINFFIQFAMFLVFWVIFFFNQETFGALTMTGWVVYSPVCIIQVMLLGLAVGIIVSSLTTKYGIWTIAVTFGVAVDVRHPRGVLHHQPVEPAGPERHRKPEPHDRAGAGLPHGPAGLRQRERLRPVVQPCGDCRAADHRRGAVQPHRKDLYGYL